LHARAPNTGAMWWLQLHAAAWQPARTEYQNVGGGHKARKLPHATQEQHRRIKDSGRVGTPHTLNWPHTLQGKQASASAGRNHTCMTRAMHSQQGQDCTERVTLQTCRPTGHTTSALLSASRLTNSTQDMIFQCLTGPPSRPPGINPTPSQQHKVCCCGLAASATYIGNTNHHAGIIAEGKAASQQALQPLNTEAILCAHTLSPQHRDDLKQTTSYKPPASPQPKLNCFAAGMIESRHNKIPHLDTGSPQPRKLCVSVEQTHHTGPHQSGSASCTPSCTINCQLSGSHLLKLR
jgi:hypothetical protein